MVLKLLFIQLQTKKTIFNHVQQSTDIKLCDSDIKLWDSDIKLCDSEIKLWDV